MASDGAMRVAIDAVAVRLGGGLTFLLSQLPYLEKCASLTIYANADIVEQLRYELSGSEIVEMPRWSRPLPLRLIWENFVLPRHLKADDVLYSVGNMAAFATKKPQVVVVQSAYMFGPLGARAVAHVGPSIAFRTKVLVQRFFGHLALRRATVLIATSEFMAAQVREASRSDVDLRVVPIAGLPLGHGPRVMNEPLPTTRPFALSIGSDLPHKDRVELVRSWPHDVEVDLVLVGSPHPRRSRERLEFEIGKRPDVHWMGPVVDRGRLAQLYAAASMVVAHSHLEGFGMTTLEAMEVGAPVVASDIPGHREVCGDAAIYYDARDGTSLARVVRRLAEDSQLREQLVEAGRARADHFSWERNASETCAILRSVRDRGRA